MEGQQAGHPWATSWKPRSYHPISTRLSMYHNDGGKESCGHHWRFGGMKSIKVYVIKNWYFGQTNVKVWRIHALWIKVSLDLELM